MTIEKLRDLGADVNTGLARCLNKEDFYLKMVNMALSDSKFEELGQAVKSNDLEKAFEICHALKGAVGNVALDPLYKVISEMTELLRVKSAADYASMYENLIKIRKQFMEA